jgi:hypothetical protein
LSEPSSCAARSRRPGGWPHAVFGRSQLGGIFLGNDRVIRERLDQCAADQGLAAEVSYRDGTLVFLGQDFR